MYDIKYFFSIKLIKQFGEQKNFFRDDKLPKNTIFQNPKNRCPPDTAENKSGLANHERGLICEPLVDRTLLMDSHQRNPNWIDLSVQS
jgi:hypothetical protein